MTRAIHSGRRGGTGVWNAIRRGLFAINLLVALLLLTHGLWLLIPNRIGTSMSDRAGEVADWLHASVMPAGRRDAKGHERLNGLGGPREDNWRVQRRD